MISVIVPVYNVEDYLERCVESLLGQSFSDYEIILVDDGSKDDSPELCDILEKKYYQVRAYHKNNGGLSSARNYGVLKAYGEWVTFVDSDDYVSSKYLQDLYSLAMKYDADMAITRVVLRSEDKAEEIRPIRFEDFVTDKKGGFFEVYIGNKVGWSGCGKLFKTNLVKDNPFLDGFYEDSASMYLYIDQCDKIAIGDYENNYKYIRREGSITATALSVKHLHIFDVCEQIEKYIITNIVDKKYYSILIYENAILQLLNRISMTKEEYKQIFVKYREKFRKSFFEVVVKRDVSLKSKVYLLLLCTKPYIFLFFTKVTFRKREQNG